MAKNIYFWAAYIDLRLYVLDGILYMNTDIPTNGSWKIDIRGHELKHGYKPEDSQAA